MTLILGIAVFSLFWFCFWFISSTLWGITAQTYSLVVGSIGFVLVVPAAVFGIVASFVWS